MTGKEISEIIEQLAETLGMASSEIIPHYALWYRISSISYMIFGLMFFYSGLLFYKKVTKSEYDSEHFIPLLIIPFVLSFIGLWIFFANIGDLFGATGISIHRLILDLRCE